jgi:4-hydroxy-tetrahydrodipicolinate synthase
MKMQWEGVIPAITTPFNEDGSIDHRLLAAHSRNMIDAGCTGVVALGSLGEGGTLEWDEKRAVLETVREALGSRAPLIAGISALSTREAVKLVQTAEDVGCSGLMVLPPYVYAGDWREMKAHVAEICDATRLRCMLYNNPIAYKTDFLPEHVAELAAGHQNLNAVKESSADVRRIAALRSLIGNRLAIFCGVDDLIVEAIFAGATGWIAGLVNAFPAESVELFRLASAGDKAGAFQLYKWFLPLLRLDTVPKFIQLIKFVQQLAGLGSERVRQPRLPLSEQEKSAVSTMFDEAMKAREQVGVGSRA